MPGDDPLAWVVPSIPALGLHPVDAGEASRK